MADIVLVHGAAHGAWCWRDVIPILRARGHRVRALDLPGHGADTTPIPEITLDRYAQAILDQTPPGAVLVGHSMGGYAITAAAEQAAVPLARLIYLCAYVPRDGLSLAQMRMRAPRQPLLPAVRMAADGLSFTLDAAMTRGLFYHDCSDAVAAYAQPRLCAQAVAPTNVPLQVTARSGDLPRHYILCEDDRTIPPEFQAEMTQGWPAACVDRMACGHSPFFADPQGLAGLLDAAVKG